MSHAEPEHNRPPEGTPVEYDDLLPVSLWYYVNHGGYWLHDRHNDQIAKFDPAMEVEDMARIVALINRE